MHTTTVNDMPRLVLTRKVNEKITVKKNGEHVAVITVGKIDRNQARLIFEADLEVEIIRLPRDKDSAD